MEEITLKDLLYLTAAIVALWGFIEKIVKPFKNINNALNEIKGQNDIRQQENDNLKAAIQNIKENVSKQGDMIYQMLDHMATNNNTGNMKRCLDAYNEYNRHSQN